MAASRQLIERARRASEELAVAVTLHQEQIHRVLAGPGAHFTGNVALHRLACHEDAAWLEVKGLAEQLNGLLTQFLQQVPPGAAREDEEQHDRQ